MSKSSSLIYGILSVGVPVLCKKAIGNINGFKLQGLLGITTNDGEIVLVQFDEILDKTIFTKNHDNFKNDDKIISGEEIIKNNNINKLVDSVVEKNGYENGGTSKNNIFYNNEISSKENSNIFENQLPQASEKKKSNAKNILSNERQNNINCESDVLIKQETISIDSDEEENEYSINQKPNKDLLNNNYNNVYSNNDAIYEENTFYNIKNKNIKQSFPSLNEGSTSNDMHQFKSECSNQLYKKNPIKNRISHQASNINKKSSQEKSNYPPITKFEREKQSEIYSNFNLYNQNFNPDLNVQNYNSNYNTENLDQSGLDFNGSINYEHDMCNQIGDSSNQLQENMNTYNYDNSNNHQFYNEMSNYNSTKKNVLENKLKNKHPHFRYSSQGQTANFDKFFE